MQNNVEEIKARLNIVDVVGEYVRLTKAGSHWKGLCPFHHEKSPSFMVNEEKQIFHCFGCAKGGDMFSFVQEIESLDFRESLKMLAEKAGVQLEQFQGGQKQDNKKRILEALELATKFYEKQLWEGMGKDKILKYLRERGLSDESIQKFRLGYSPSGWDNILKFLTGRGFSIEEIASTGLLVQKENGGGQYDRFRDRIMFPIQDTMGNVIGYSARVAPGGDESQAKYINSPETVVYHKSNALYGIYNAKQDIKQKNYTLIVEGQMDVIASHQAGLKNTIAVSGTALTNEQVKILKRFTPNIAMLFDMDSAGQKAAERSVDLCLENDMKVKIVTLAEGKDAAEAVQKDPAILLASINSSKPAIEHFFEQSLTKFDATTSEGKQEIAKEVLGHVSHAQSPIEKAHWIKEVAHRLDVEEKVVGDVLKSSSTTVAPRSEQENYQQEEGLDKSFKKRSDILREALVGLLVSDPIVWKEMVEKEKGKAWVQDDKFIALIFNSGEESGYNIDIFIEKMDDAVMAERIRKIYFNAKYRFQQDDVIEYTTEDIKQMAVEHMAEYEKELQKEKMHSIIREIEIAEQKGDKETLAKLMSEFTRLSQQSN